MNTPMSQRTWEELAKEHAANKKKRSIVEPKNAPKNNNGDVAPAAPTQPQEMVTKSEVTLLEQMDAILKLDPGMHAAQLMHQVMNMMDKVLAAQLRQQVVYLGRIQKLEETLNEVKDVMLDHIVSHDEQELHISQIEPTD